MVVYAHRYAFGFANWNMDSCQYIDSDEYRNGDIHEYVGAYHHFD